MTKKDRCETLFEPRHFKAMQYWYNLTPKKRAELMQVVNSRKKSTCGKFNDIIKYIEKKKLRGKRRG